MSSPKGYPSMQMNGITKRPMMTAQRPAEELPVTLTPQHEEIIRYIYDQWSRVAQEMDRYNHHNGADNRGMPPPPTYFQGSRESTPQMKDFKAVDLERQRMHHKSDHHHSHPAP